MQRFLSLIFILCLLVSCAGGGDALPTIGPAPDPNNGQDSSEALISFAVQEYERASYETLIAQFQAEQPSIKVVLVSIDSIINYGQGDMTEQDLLRQMASGADTFSTSSFYLPAHLYNSPLLLNLLPLMEADASFQRADFYPGVLENSTEDNRLSVLPQYLYLDSLNYNKELFSQANIPTPQANWTWNDLLGIAQALGNGQTGPSASYGFADGDGATTLDILLSQRNFDLFTTAPEQIQLDSETPAQAIEQLISLANSNALFLENLVGEGPSSYELIQEGRIGIWNGMQFTFYPAIDSNNPSELNDENIGVLPYPQGSNIRNSITGIEGYMISSGTRYPNAAWKWIEFLTRSPREGFGGWGNNRVPSRDSLAGALNYWPSLSADTAATYKWILENNRAPRPNYNSTGFTAFYSLQTALQGALQSSNPNIPQLLREAQAKYQEDLANIIIKPTPTPDSNPVVVATPVINEPNAGATVITFMPIANDLSAMRRLIERFNQENPDLFVRVPTPQTYQNASNFSDLSKLGDCFSWHNPPNNDSDFAALLNLQPLFDSDSSFNLNDYPKALFGTYSHNGGIYGLPYAFNLQTFNYNRTAFDAAGIAYPNANWTNDDFLAAAQTLTQGSGDNKQYGYASLQGLIYDLIFFANNHFNARLTSGSGDQIRMNFSDPNAVRAIQWYIDLAKTHQVMPPISISYSSDSTPEEDLSWQHTINGRVNMWFSYGRIFYGDSAPFEEAYAPLPVGNKGLSSNNLSSQAFYISSQSQNPQACWQLLKYLSAQTDNSLLGGNIPARISIANSDAYAAQADSYLIDLYKAYSELLQRDMIQGDSLNSFFSEQMDLYWFYKAIDEAYRNNANLEQGLIEAQNTTNAYLDCIAEHGKPYKYATCANQVDPTYKGFHSEDATDNPIIGIPRG
jgi:ABC-type glycerol-3-phosphate transport system substrate-binding protein